MGVTRVGADQRLLTITEAADRLSVSYETLRRWIEKGAVAAVRVGPVGAIRVPAAVVESLVRPHRGA